MYTDPAKLLSMTGLCFLWPLCCHPPTYYSAPSYTTQAGFIYVSSIIHRLHSQLRRLTRPQRTPRLSELNFNNSIVFIYLCIIIFFFNIKYYVEPSYTTKTYAPSYYSTKALTDIIILLLSFLGITLSQVITNRPRPLPFIIRTRSRLHPVITSPRFPTQRLPLFLIISETYTTAAPIYHWEEQKWVDILVNFILSMCINLISLCRSFTDIIRSHRFRTQLRR